MPVVRDSRELRMTFSFGVDEVAIRWAGGRRGLEGGY